MTCAEVEILLCDYVDGTLAGSERTALEQHLTQCVPCSELASDITGVVGFMGRAAVVEPPAELLTRILHEIPSVRLPWWRRMFGSWFEKILQPRYAMGMAMTVLSFSMIARFAGIEPRQLRPADLDPVKIWVSADDRAHRVWDRTVKYYENLRWVLELQSRLKEWTDQEQELQKNSQGADTKNQNSAKQAPGAREEEGKK